MVSRRSRPGSSSTTRMRALRFGVCGVASCMAASIGKPLRLPSLRWLLRRAFVSRAFDVGDGVELGLRVGERLLETGVLVALGSQALGELGDSIVGGPVGALLQPPVVSLHGLLTI